MGMLKKRGGPKHRVSATLYLFLSLALMLALPGCSVKPEPYSEGQLMQLALRDQAAILEGVPALAPDGRLSLKEAVIRALVFNFDHRLALSENMAADRERVLAAAGMLPDLSAGGNFYDRSNENASSSMSYKTRNESLEPSFSTPPGRQWGNLEFSWSILDCGLSYYQAKQQADRVLISLERRRRTMNTIVKDVIATYYRARAAQVHLGRINSLLSEAESALAQYRRIEQEKAEPLPAVLENQRKLMTTIARLKRIKSDLEQARVQLAALCNYSPREKVRLTTGPGAMPAIKQSIEDLELMGLHRRPELREEHYMERVDIAGIKQEILKMFPAVKVLASWNFDRNPYLVNNVWSEAGVQVSASLLKLAVTGPKGKKAAEAKREVSQMRRLALTMATLVQINLSRQQYQVALEELRTARGLRDLENRLLTQVETEAGQGAEGRLALVQQKTQVVSATLACDLAGVDAYTALGNLYFAVGVGFGDELPPDTSIDQVALAVENGLAAFTSGRLPELPQPEEVSEVEAPTVLKDGLTALERREALERNVGRK